MRVRYGKPIKVKSTYSDYFSSGTNAYRCSKVVENGIATLTKTSDDYATLYKDMTPTSGHTYFYYCKQRVLDTVGSSDRLNLTVNTTSGYNQNVTAPTVNEWYEFYGKSNVTSNFIRFEPRCYAANGIKFQLTTPITIDLTEIGLDNLTAQEFYNKYNKYFPLIATGEEITIDDKAGQVSYSSQKSLKSIVGKQVGLTADNSFNIYSVTSVATVALCNNKFGYSTVPDLASRFTNDDAIQIVEGHKYFVHVKVHNMLDRSAQRWMCMRFISTAGASYALSGNIYSYTWKFTTNTVSAILTGTTTGNLAYTYFGDFPDSLKMTIATEYPESYLIIDMTALGEDSLTVEEFYTKYKGYFSDLENGKQIVAGKGKVAGGSSDIYYGYNQTCRNEKWGWDTVNGGWYNKPSNTSYSFADKALTLTPTEDANIKVFATYVTASTDGTTGFPFASDRKYYIRLKIYSTKATTWFLSSGGYNTSNFSVPANEWYTADQLLTGTSYSAERPYFGIYMQNEIACTTSDSFIFKELEIIDLTDWYGEGSEPTTVEEFKQTFPNLYYSYSKKRLLNKYMINKLVN